MTTDPFNGNPHEEEGLTHRVTFNIYNKRPTYALGNEGDKLDTGAGRLTNDDKNRNMSK